ncbi:MAG: tail fiber protein [Marinobacter sp.]|uniref:phage tail protein n=1 Tax=Marinobacter sp. TaxID=50741 RepID=UPI00299E8031|nr:tail fiber protein [Marinobacter sp.]MDX1755698.1 tail fiber protein [Marinobacter sp.]
MACFNYAPRGWEKCDGQLLMISDYQALFSLLGTQFGGDGRTTFALPDLRGRVPIHQGQGKGLPAFFPMGQFGGQYTEELTAAQLPSHTHNLADGTQVTFPAFSQGGNTGTPGPGAVMAEINSGFSPLEAYSTETPDTRLKPGSLSGQTTATGGNKDFSITQPYSVVNFIICTDGGEYPPRQ